MCVCVRERERESERGSVCTKDMLINAVCFGVATGVCVCACVRVCACVHVCACVYHRHAQLSVCFGVATGVNPEP